MNSAFVSLQSAPSAAEALHQSFKQKKGKLTEKTKVSVMDRYGNAAEVAPDVELLLGQTERCARCCSPKSLNAELIMGHMQRFASGS